MNSRSSVLNLTPVLSVAGVNLTLKSVPDGVRNLVEKMPKGALHHIESPYGKVFCTAKDLILRAWGNRCRTWTEIENYVERKLDELVEVWQQFVKTVPDRSCLIAYLRMLFEQNIAISPQITATAVA